MVQSEGIEILERRAAEDLWIAEMILDNNDELMAQISFHLQQFIKKRMEVGLRERLVKYPKTHDLSVLLDLFPQEKISETDKEFVQILSKYAAESRYELCTDPPWSGRQMLEKAKKFAELIETLWDDA